ncbi:MAG: hypothetical protein WA857_09415 [Candidatus Acidiferrum sp.]
MQVFKLSAVFLGGALLFSASAFASNTNKKSLHLYEKVTVEGKQLPPGNYKVEWSGIGPEVTVNILKGKETVATTPARVVTQAESNNQDGYALKPGKDGGQTLAQVFFSGEKYDLDINPASGATASQGANSSGVN